MNEHSIVYPVDSQLITRSAEVTVKPGFSELRGADLVFACIAYLEDAFLITIDSHFSRVTADVKVIDLNLSRTAPEYRRQFGL